MNLSAEKGHLNLSSRNSTLGDYLEKIFTHRRSMCGWRMPVLVDAALCARLYKLKSKVALGLFCAVNTVAVDRGISESG